MPFHATVSESGPVADERSQKRVRLPSQRLRSHSVAVATPSKSENTAAKVRNERLHNRRDGGEDLEQLPLHVVVFDVSATSAFIVPPSSFLTVPHSGHRSGVARDGVAALSDGATKDIQI